MNRQKDIAKRSDNPQKKPGSPYNSDVLFTMDSFQNPQSIFSPIYSWVWNSPISRPLIQMQLNRMNDMGIRAIYIIPEPPEFRPTGMITKLTPPYLSDEFFALIRYAAEYAEGLSMTVWLYDEGGWPSGSACGQVLQKEPDCESEIISEKTISLKSRETYLPSPSALSAFTEDYRRITSEYTADKDCVILEYRRTKRPGHLPCLLKKKAVDRFIGLTYDRYQQFLGDTFGVSTHAFFTDEAILAYPYTVLDSRDFQEKTGFNFESCLPALFHQNALGEQGEKFRIAYVAYTSKLFCQTYMQRLHHWCREHNMLLTGHMDGDHILTDYRRNVGNILEQLRCMDIPGIDVIANQIYPGDEQNRLFPRMAASAANQAGNLRTLTESFAVYGSGLTFSVMRYVIGAQAVRGINTFNIMSMSSGSEDGFLCHQFRPNFLLPSPMAKFLPEFNRCLARVSYVASIGKPLRDTALYLPLRDLWSEHQNSEAVLDNFYSIGRQLEEALIDFDIVDDGFLLSAVIREGRLCQGYAAYSYISVPDCNYMPQAVKDKLTAFVQCGGTVFHPTQCPGEIPTALTSVHTSTPPNGLRASVRKASDKSTVYLLFQEKEDTFHGIVSFDAAHDGCCYELDLNKGCLYSCESAVALQLRCGEIRCFLVTKEKYPAHSHRLQPSQKLISEICTFDGSICQQFSIRSDFAPSLLEENTSLGQISVGEWAPYVGRNFSGGVEYKCNFQLEQTDHDIMLALGQVCYCCEIAVNNNFQAKLLFPPYEAQVPSAYLRCGSNQLTIRVYNTPANQYVSLDYGAVPDAAKGTYHSRTLEYEKRSLHGGLLEPVKIYEL